MKIFFLSYRLTLFVKLLVFNYITIVFMPNCKKKDLQPSQKFWQRQHFFVRKLIFNNLTSFFLLPKCCHCCQNGVFVAKIAFFVAKIA